MKSRVATVVAVVVALAWSPPARAGFRIQEVDPEFSVDVSVSSFQGGKARVDGALEGLTVVVDVKSGEGWLIDSAARRYAGGKIADLAEELRKAELTQGDDDAAADRVDKAAPVEPARPRAVAVRDLGPGERLLGYDTRHHQVLVDGELIEELWLAPKIRVDREIDLAAFGVIMQRMLGGGEGLSQGYEESEAYRALRAGGYPLRHVLFFVGEKSTVEVTSVVETELAAADFVVPKGFARVGYTELLLGGD